MVVTGVIRAPLGNVAPRRRGVEGRSFSVKAEQSAPAEETVATAGVAATSLLALQEAQSEALEDREARRHGTEMVDELTDLQRMLLGGDVSDLDRLVALVARPITTADPALAGLLRAVKMRAGIELARRGHAASMLHS